MFLALVQKRDLPTQIGFNETQLIMIEERELYSDLIKIQTSSMK